MRFPISHRLCSLSGSTQHASVVTKYLPLSQLCDKYSTYCNGCVRTTVSSSAYITGPGDSSLSIVELVFEGSETVQESRLRSLAGSSGRPSSRPRAGIGRYEDAVEPACKALGDDGAEGVGEPEGKVIASGPRLIIDFEGYSRYDL